MKNITPEARGTNRQWYSAARGVKVGYGRMRLPGAPLNILVLMGVGVLDMVECAAGAPLDILVLMGMGASDMVECASGAPLDILVLMGVGASFCVVTSAVRPVTSGQTGIRPSVHAQGHS